MNTSSKQILFRLSQEKLQFFDQKLKTIGLKRQQFLERAIDEFIQSEDTAIKDQLLNDDEFILQLASKVMDLV